MLKLIQMTLQNFGAYKDTQIIQFPNSGVAVVYGSNMRGKTTLLNALRYAFLGQVLDRSYRAVPLHTMCNLEKTQEGQYGFKIVLEFEFEGDHFELTRSFSPRRHVDTPQSDTDYEEQRVLRRNGNSLPRIETDRELARIMPEQVTRFFLFDGELLQDYEDLVRTGSDTGRKLTDSIERILGVPVLTNAKTDVQEQADQSLKQLSKVAQREQRTRELGALIDAKVEQRDYLRRDLERLKRDLLEAHNRKQHYQELVRQDERSAAMMDERTSLEADISQIEARMAEKKERRRELLAAAWRGMLHKRAQAVVLKLQQQVEVTRDLITRKAVTVQMLDSLQRAISEGYCFSCQQPVSSLAKEHLIRVAASMQESSDRPDVTDADGLIAQVQRLRAFEGEDKSDLVEAIGDQLDDLAVDRADKRARLVDIDTALATVDKEAIQEARNNYDTAVSQVQVLSKAVDETTEQISGMSDTIRELQKKLEAAGGGDTEKEKRKRHIYSQLADLFTEGVREYREQLKSSVEADASKLFLQLTSEPEYGGLRINDAYGLTIIHRDGQSITNRSAGAEHIVALSLMGALHKNAPLHGPIIMDTPLTRLDIDHKANIVQALPQMAGQVVLLAIDSEINPQEARNQLAGSLKREYKLVRRSARHTTIEEV